jgi:hypothetical protein
MPLRDQRGTKVISVDPVDESDVCGKRRADIARRCNRNFTSLRTTVASPGKYGCVAVITPA